MGRRSHLFSLGLDAAGLGTGAPVDLTRGIDGDVPGKPFGGREDFAISPGRPRGCLLGAGGPQG